MVRFGAVIPQHGRTYEEIKLIASESGEIGVRLRLDL